MMWMFLMLSCAQQPTDAQNINIEGELLTKRILRIEKDIASKEAELADDLLVIIQRIEKLESRVKNVEIALTDFQEPKLEAEKIPFDPRATKLDATNLQSALTEIAGLISELEKKSQDFGEPGPGLFQETAPGGQRGPGGGRAGPPGGQNNGPGGPGAGPGQDKGPDQGPPQGPGGQGDGPGGPPP